MSQRNSENLYGYLRSSVVIMKVVMIVMTIIVYCFCELSLIVSDYFNVVLFFYCVITVCTLKLCNSLFLSYIVFCLIVSMYFGLIRDNMIYDRFIVMF